MKLSKEGLINEKLNLKSMLSDYKNKITGDHFLFQSDFTNGRALTKLNKLKELINKNK